jgi:hypothetical protein
MPKKWNVCQWVLTYTRWSVVLTIVKRLQVYDSPLTRKAWLENKNAIRSSHTGTSVITIPRIACTVVVICEQQLRCMAWDSRPENPSRGKVCMSHAGGFNGPNYWWNSVWQDQFHKVSSIRRQVTSASLGWCHKSAECANWFARTSVCFCSQSGGVVSIGQLM